MGADRAAGEGGGPARRILFVTRSLEGGGAERQLVVLANGLKWKGHDVTVAVLYPGGRLEAELVGTGVKCISFGKRGFWDFGGFFLRAILATRRIKPDIIHGYMDVGNIVALVVKLLSGKSRLVWGVRASRSDSEEYDRAGRLLSRLLVPASRIPDLIICNSEAGAIVAIERGYPRSKMLVIPNGIDTVRFQPRQSDRARLRGAWQLSDDEIVVGMAARPDPMKDFGTFASAAALLLNEYPRVRFVCAGDWIEPYRTDALTLLQRSNLGDRLKWLGYVPDMPAFYNALDISTSSSAFGEGVPNAVAEAMACGVPCVVTDVGDSRQLVGETGIVVPPRDPRALADAWRALLGRRSPELSRACRDRIIREYGVEALIDETERALGLRNERS